MPFQEGAGLFVAVNETLSMFRSLQLCDSKLVLAIT